MKTCAIQSFDAPLMVEGIKVGGFGSRSVSL